jgi:Ca2+-binding EF-hand superfamily protein
VFTFSVDRRLNAKAVISQFDTDGDGKLNLREFQRLHAEL